jgi:hypothetical protein
MNATKSESSTVFVVVALSLDVPRESPITIHRTGVFCVNDMRGLAEGHVQRGHVHKRHLRYNFRSCTAAVSFVPKPLDSLHDLPVG